MSLNKVQKFIEAINSYYAFAALLYVTVLYALRHSGVFLWLLLIATPLLAAWTGYLIRGILQRYNLRYGFKVLSDVMTYEIINGQKSVLRYSTTLKADADRLITYPICHQWTGNGKASMPVISGEGRQLLGVVTAKDGEAGYDITPYQETVPSEGRWDYWLIGLTPPAYKGDIVEIKYSQDFIDKKQTAKPYLYYVVRTPMARLELNVKFPADALPKAVTCSYTKPSDPRRKYVTADIRFDPDKQWATWVVDHPKKGYWYRIEWQ